jgi:putative intracellular protease/amidase
LEAVWLYMVGAAALAVLLIWLGMPALLRAMGLHRHVRLPKRNLAGRRALVIATSHDTLGETGRKTGVFASEMTAPYYTFLDAGMHVDVASIRGGEIPIEPVSLKWPLRSHFDSRFLGDADFRRRVKDATAIGAIDGGSYDAVFLAGGWGAAYDFEQSPELGRLLLQAHAAGAVIGGVCHGPLGLLAARDGNAAPLVSGRRLTAVTDKQVRELGITHTPRHPERDLRAAGAQFESRTGFRDIFASHVVADGKLVTGQNQNDGAATADRMMQEIPETRSGGRG